MEGFVDVGADGVHRIGDVREVAHEGGGIHLLEHSEDRLPHRAGHVFLRKGGVGLDGGHELGHSLVHRAGELLSGSTHGPFELGLHKGAGAGQKRRLLLADEGDVPVIIHIRARCADVREIVRKRDLPVIAGHFDPGPGLVEVLVRTDGHLAAVVQGQALRLGRDGQHRQEQRKKKRRSFHIYTF